MARSFRLPNGAETPDVHRYVREWRSLGRTIAWFLGGHLVAFDPRLTFRMDGEEEDLQITVGVAQKLDKAIRAVFSNMDRKPWEGYDS